MSARARILIVDDNEDVLVSLVDRLARDYEVLTAEWRRQRNIRLGFGLGIDQGYANVGRIGFEGRYDYAAIGPVTNCSARVCSEAGDGQVLVTQPVYAAVETLVEAELVGDIELKGFYEPIRVYNILRLK